MTLSSIVSIWNSYNEIVQLINDSGNQQLADAVKEHGCDATYLPSFAAIEEFVTTHCQPGDLLITMGAGDVVTIGEDLLKA